MQTLHIDNNLENVPNWPANETRKKRKKKKGGAVCAWVGVGAGAGPPFKKEYRFENSESDHRDDLK